MNFDLSLRHHYYFNEIAKIPHGSRNEKELSNYIVNFAKERNLKYIQDEAYNVVIYKEGSKGYETSAPLILEGHMDMVCEANKDTIFDFEKDSLKLRVEEDWLMATGTTLGADDGVAVAYMLAILEEDEIAHPPLECCFTVKEETGLEGAQVLKKEYFKAKRLICLDSSGEKRACISTAGGLRIISHLNGKKIENKHNCYALFINGLMGGHSGSLIHTNRENAIKVANRLVKELSEKYPIYILQIEGGLKENAIPRECEIRFACDCDYETLKKEVEERFEAIQLEIGTFEKEVSCKFEEIEKSKECFDESTSKNLLNYIYLVPNGFKKKSDNIENLTVTSLNLGIVRTNDNGFDLTSAIRSVFDSAVDDLARQIETLAKMLNGSATAYSRYSGWNYNPESRLREYFKKALKEIADTDMELYATHGGNECGVFAKLGIEDIVACGPIMEDIHTPRERLSISSFDRFYQVLLRILEQCK